MHVKKTAAYRIKSYRALSSQQARTAAITETNNAVKKHSRYTRCTHTQSIKSKEKVANCYSNYAISSNSVFLQFWAVINGFGGK